MGTQRVVRAWSVDASCGCRVFRFQETTLGLIIKRTSGVRSAEVITMKRVGHGSGLALAARGRLRPAIVSSSSCSWKN